MPDPLPLTTAEASLFENLTSEFGPWDALHSRFEPKDTGNAEIAPATPLFCYHEL